MAHNKDRTRVSIADVDWSDPKLSALLEKTEGLSVDNRDDMPATQVTVRMVGSWGADAINVSALLVADIDGTLVLATRVPLPHGGDVQIAGLPGGGPGARWAVVTEEREGRRVEDQGQEIFLNWLRPR